MTPLSPIREEKEDSQRDLTQGRKGRREKRQEKGREGKRRGGEGGGKERKWAGKHTTNQSHTNTKLTTKNGK